MAVSVKVVFREACVVPRTSWQFSFHCQSVVLFIRRASCPVEDKLHKCKNKRWEIRAGKKTLSIVIIAVKDEM